MPALSAYDVTLSLQLDDVMTVGLLKAHGTFKKTTDDMARDAKKQADALEREAKRSADAAAREAKKAADAQEREAKRAAEARGREAKKAADAEAREAERSAAATKKAVAQAEADALRTTSGRGRNVQNVAFQFQDALVQLEGGTSVFRVLGQQLPQMLVGFGALGAVVGVAAAGLGLLAGQFTDVTTAQERAAISQKSFNQVAQTTTDLFSKSEQEAIKYAQSLSLVEAGMLNIAKGEVEKALRDQEKVFKDSSDAVRSEITRLQKDLVERGVTLNPNLDPVFQKLYDELEKLKNSPLTVGNIDQAKEQLTILGDGVKQARINLIPLQDELTKSGRAAFEMNKQTDYLNQVMGRLNELTTLGARFLQMLGFSAAEATGHFSQLTGSVGGLLGKFSQEWQKLQAASDKGATSAVEAAEAQARAMDGTKAGNKEALNEQSAIRAGQEAYNKELNDTGNYLKALSLYQRAYNAQKEQDRKADQASKEKPHKDLLGALKDLIDADEKSSERFIASREAEAKALDGTVEGNRAARQEQSAVQAGQEAYNRELSQTGNYLKALAQYQRAYTAQKEIDRKLNQARPDPEAKKDARQQTRVDNTLGQQEDEIALNKQLIEAYGRGEEALDNLRAAYEALTAARRLNLKEGTAEYQQYVDQYRTNAQTLRDQRRMMSDQQKGKTLTESLMTSQEKYNKQIAEYDRLLQEGAITQKTYERAVSEAAESNFGYVQGLTAIGDAIEQGAMNATSFEDALLKIGIALGKLLLQAALFGSGPLSGLFNAITGTTGGLIGGFASSGGPPGIGAAGTGGSMAAAYGARARGGDVKPGQGYMVGEHGPEPFIPSVPGTIIPTEALGGGNVLVNHRVTMYINATGDKQVVAAAQAAATQAYKQSIRDMPTALQKWNKRVSP